MARTHAGTHARALLTFLAVAGVAAAFGCSSDQGALENVGTSSENIYGGTADLVLNRVVSLVGLGAGCTGTLLSPQLVLTARHCGFAQAKPGQVIAYLGALSTNPVDWAYNLKATANPECQAGEPSCNTSPPPTHYKTDIAIIRLNKRFLNIPGVAEPFEVRFDPPKGSGATGWVGENATLVGWGLVSCPGGATPILRQRLDNFKVVHADKSAFDYTNQNWGIRESLDGDSGDPAKGPMSGDSGGGWFYVEDPAAGLPLSIFATTQSASYYKSDSDFVCDGLASAPWLAEPAIARGSNRC